MYKLVKINQIILIDTVNYEIDQNIKSFQISRTVLL